MSRRLEAIAGDALEALLDEPTPEALRDAADVAARAATSRRRPSRPSCTSLTLRRSSSELLAPMYRRSLADHSITWCREWWRHAEAITRLAALWRSWEHLRLDPATGMSVWLPDYLDHHARSSWTPMDPSQAAAPTSTASRLAALRLTPSPPAFFAPS